MNKIFGITAGILGIAIIVFFGIPAMEWVFDKRPDWTTDDSPTVTANRVVKTPSPTPAASSTPSETDLLIKQLLEELKKESVPSSTTQPTVTATPAPQATATPEPQATAKPIPDVSGDPSFEELRGFNPVRDYQQSCEPERVEGCTWDVGAEGSHSDILGRHVVQVGIVKGVKIDWPKGNLHADPSPNGRCALVILTPDSWFEDLHVVDANVSTYNVDARDWAGWMKTLAVQAAYEQTTDYGCPAKTFEQIPQWTSSTQSPPCGTPGWPNCTSSMPEASSTPTTSETPTADCPTVNCMERVQTSDHGGNYDFKVGEAVYGSKITMSDGTSYTDCWIEKAEMDGEVVDGVVNPWKTEVGQARKCAA